MAARSSTPRSLLLEQRGRGQALDIMASELDRTVYYTKNERACGKDKTSWWAVVFVLNRPPKVAMDLNRRTAGSKSSRPKKEGIGLFEVLDRVAM